MEYGKIQNLKQQGNVITIEFEKQYAIVSVITDEILHFQVLCWKKDYKSLAVEGDKSVACEFTANMDSDCITIKTKAVTARIYDDFYTEIYGRNGKLLLADYKGEREIKQKISENMIEMLKAEGHETLDSLETNHKIEIIKKLEKDDCFYGLGDKTGFLNKRHFAYENWNSDIPQVHMENMPAIYKSIPFVMCKKKEGVFGLFFDNTFHSYIDLGKENDNYFFYGVDEGNLDYYFIAGDKLPDIVRNYTYLTGRAPMPQLWTLGYHQCRWGYECAKDIREVAYGMREHRIPCESVQYDIDYMDEFKVFTWDEKHYEAPGKLMDELAEIGFKPVVIIDPGTKKQEGYYMYDEGVENDYFAKTPEGDIYVNAVWPGDATYPDFGRKEVRDWWGKSHRFLTDMGVKAIWNDMNEPASFNGPLPDDVVFHIEDRETNHAEVHNVYGHFMGMATFNGMKELTGKRPLVITRACYSGSQKYTAVWTGDNQSLWSHLQMLIPQLCNLGMSGFALAGTDIGGFGGDANPELLCRWIEAAIFSPFFRNHSAKGTRNQEPWVFGEEVTDIYRKYVELRYKFLPYIYDLFYKCQETGLPVMRPLVLHYEDDVNTHNLNGEFLVGESMLVAPVVEQGATVKLVYLPEGVWYDYWTGKSVQGGRYIMREAGLDVCPIYIKEGSIIPTYEVVEYVGQKPYDKLVLLTTPGAATYEHYQDNGEDYKYQDGEYNLYRFIKSKDGRLDTELVHEGYEQYKTIEIKAL